MRRNPLRRETLAPIRSCSARSSASGEEPSKFVNGAPVGTFRRPREARGTTARPPAVTTRSAPAQPGCSRRNRNTAALARTSPRPLATSAHRATRPRGICARRAATSRRKSTAEERHPLHKDSVTIGLSRGLSFRAVVSLLLRNGWIVTQNPRRDILRGDILVEDGKIAAIGGGKGGADEGVECSDCADLPGLINMPGHLAETILPVRAD